jgi:hypothetical protein
MDSKFSSFINNIKNMNSTKIIDTFKKNQENFHPKNMVGLARKAVDTARTFSKEEIQILMGKVNVLSHKTNSEIEKMLSNIVSKVLKGQPENSVTPEIRDEITNILVEHNNGKNIIPIIKYVNSVVVSNAPTSIESIKNFRNNIASTLISDAKKRISEKNTIEAQIVNEPLEKKAPKKERQKNRDNM